MASPPNIRYLWFEVAVLLIAMLCGYAVSDDDPVRIVARALLCFDDRVVYSRCDFAFRLSVSGDLNIPEAATDAYCSGPCLDETDLVLHCVDQIMGNFVFYNKATIGDIRDTIRDGCSRTRLRGHFSVLEHMQAADKGTRVLHQWSSVLPTLLLGLSLTPLLLCYG